MMEYKIFDKTLRLHFPGFTLAAALSLLVLWALQTGENVPKRIELLTNHATQKTIDTVIDLCNQTGSKIDVNAYGSIIIDEADLPLILARLSFMRAFESRDFNSVNEVPISSETERYKLDLLRKSLSIISMVKTDLEQQSELVRIYLTSALPLHLLDKEIAAINNLSSMILGNTSLRYEIHSNVGPVYQSPIKTESNLDSICEDIYDAVNMYVPRNRIQCDLYSNAKNANLSVSVDEDWIGNPEKSERRLKALEALILQSVPEIGRRKLGLKVSSIEFKAREFRNRRYRGEALDDFSVKLTSAGLWLGLFGFIGTIFRVNRRRKIVERERVLEVARASNKLLEELDLETQENSTSRVGDEEVIDSLPPLPDGYSEHCLYCNAHTKHFRLEESNLCCQICNSVYTLNLNSQIMPESGKALEASVYYKLVFSIVWLCVAHVLCYLYGIETREQVLVTLEIVGVLLIMIFGIANIAILGKSILDLFTRFSMYRYPTSIKRRLLSTGTIKIFAVSLLSVSPSLLLLPFLQS